MKDKDRTNKPTHKMNTENKDASSGQVQNLVIFGDTMKIICIIRGWYWTIKSEVMLFGSSDFIPITGHEGQELENGSIICSTCGVVIFGHE